MAHSYESNSEYNDYSHEQWTNSHNFQRTLTERVETKIEEADIAPGRILWLPSLEELPDRAVRRVRGKGAIEEGIFSHPVVIISRPADEDHAVHFHLITSLQGKTLDQLYFKATEFHTSRRSWYLPIAPTPDHPDANSKKTKKRFPTLDLANAAHLRWDSYVNIRHVYKIDWKLLKVYANPDEPNTHMFRFERESMIRLLAKSKILTMYEPGPQSQSTVEIRRGTTDPVHMAMNIRVFDQRLREYERQGSEPSSVVSVGGSTSSSPPQSDFCLAKASDRQKAGRLPKVPPDTSVRPTTSDLIPTIMTPWLGRVWGPLDCDRNGKVIAKAMRDAKGVTAVLWASVY